VAVHQVICKGDNADIRPTEDSTELQDVQTGQMGVDSECRGHVPEVKMNMH
jgi:hypothetical protein